MGDILFRQDRIGQHGRTFQILKFRTMEDGQVTRLGKYLRRTHLDELPQIWNIIRGDMALIGPRPEEPHRVPDIEGWEERLEVKPGLTGLAQIYLGYDPPADIRHYFDVLYVHRRSWWLNAKIILLTPVWERRVR